MRKNFDYTTAATIISNRLFSDREYVFAMLSHMTGYPVAGPQYDAARAACASYLCEQYPALAAIDFTDCNEHNYPPLLDEVRLVLGDMVEVEAGCVTQAGLRNPYALTA